jgi:hypothetical protein
VRRRLKRAAEKVRQILSVCRRSHVARGTRWATRKLRPGGFHPDESVASPVEEANRELLREADAGLLSSSATASGAVLARCASAWRTARATPRRGGAAFRRHPRAHPPDRGKAPAQAAPPHPQPQRCAIISVEPSRRATTGAPALYGPVHSPTAGRPIPSSKGTHLSCGLPPI